MVEHAKLSRTTAMSVSVALATRHKNVNRVSRRILWRITLKYREKRSIFRWNTWLEWAGGSWYTVKRYHSYNSKCYCTRCSLLTSFIKLPYLNLLGECFWKTMYPFGPDQNDTEMSTDDQYEWRCERVDTSESGILFFTQRHYKLFVSKRSFNITGFSFM